MLPLSTELPRQHEVEQTELWLGSLDVPIIQEHTSRRGSMVTKSDARGSVPPNQWVS